MSHEKIIVNISRHFAAVSIREESNRGGGGTSQHWRHPVQNRNSSRAPVTLWAEKIPGLHLTRRPRCMGGTLPRKGRRWQLWGETVMGGPARWYTSPHPQSMWDIPPWTMPSDTHTHTHTHTCPCTPPPILPMFTHDCALEEGG